MKHGRFCPLPNFPHKLNFTIFTGPILRQLILFGNASINSLDDTIVAPEVEFINCTKNVSAHVGLYNSFENMSPSLYIITILQLWKWGQPCLRSARATILWGNICSCTKYMGLDACYMSKRRLYALVHTVLVPLICNAAFIFTSIEIWAVFHLHCWSVLIYFRALAFVVSVNKNCFYKMGMWLVNF